MSKVNNESVVGISRTADDVLTDAEVRSSRFLDGLLKEVDRLNTICSFLQEEITKSVLEKKLLEEKARSGEFNMGHITLS